MYTYSIAQSINSRALGIFFPYALSVLNFGGLLCFVKNYLFPEIVRKALL